MRPCLFRDDIANILVHICPCRGDTKICKINADRMKSEGYCHVTNKGWRYSGHVDWTVWLGQIHCSPTAWCHLPQTQGTPPFLLPALLLQCLFMSFCLSSNKVEVLKMFLLRDTQQPLYTQQPLCNTIQSRSLLVKLCLIHAILTSVIKAIGLCVFRRMNMSVRTKILTLK